MVRYIFSIALIAFLSVETNGQEFPLKRFDFLIGQWSGNGEGFSSGRSEIESSFMYRLDSTFIEVKNHSVFKPTEKDPAGSVHMDWGMISYDRKRRKYVYRQFHNEGFVNQYILNESLSDDNIFIFESEVIENFVEGGAARFTINWLGADHIETIFDVSFPGKGFSCLGRNDLFLRIP